MSSGEQRAGDRALRPVLDVEMSQDRQNASRPKKPAKSTLPSGVRGRLARSSVDTRNNASGEPRALSSLGGGKGNGRGAEGVGPSHCEQGNGQHGKGVGA
jgi:hypothetical protein